MRWKIGELPNVIRAPEWNATTVSGSERLRDPHCMGKRGFVSRSPESRRRDEYLPNDGVESAGKIPMVLKENLRERVVLRCAVVQSLECNFGVMPQLRVQLASVELRIEKSKETDHLKRRKGHAG